MTEHDDQGTPWVAYHQPTLDALPRVQRGDAIHCPHCDVTHELRGSVARNGGEDDVILFYGCGERLWLAAVDGRLTMRTPADASGTL